MGAGGLVTDIVGSCFCTKVVTLADGVGRDDSSRALSSLSSAMRTGIGTSAPAPALLVEGAEGRVSNPTFSYTQL